MKVICPRSDDDTMDIATFNQSQRDNATLDSMNLMGTVLSGIAYGTSTPAPERYDSRMTDFLFAGVVVTICTLVLCARTRTRTPKLSWRTLVTCWLLMLATLSTALQIKWAELAFVTHRPNNPSDFIKMHTNNWIYVTLNVL